MSEKKRRFGLADHLSNQLGQMITIGENTERLFRDAVIPCSRIEPDPDNPRRLAVTQDDLFKGSADLTDIQQVELSKLTELAASIKTSGLINPITVVKNGELYRVIAGERRFLATLLIGMDQIDARVFETKPGSYELKLIQWFENTEREDLSIIDRLDNIRAIIQAHQLKTGIKKVTAKQLGEMIGLSVNVATCYLNLLHAPADVYDAICLGKLTNVEVAALIANTPNEDDRAVAITSLERGESIATVRQLLASKRQRGVTTSVANGTRQGLSLGKIKSAKTLKTIVEGILQLPAYEQYAEMFSSEDWSNPRSSLGAFKRLITLLEKEV